MTTLSLPQSGRSTRQRALVLLGGAVLLLAGLGARTWLPTDDAAPAATSPAAVDAPLFVLPPQPADSVTPAAAAPGQAEEPWERNFREARHPEP